MDGYPPRIYTNGKETVMPNLEKSFFTTKPGDRFMLLFDFAKHECIAYFNGSKLGFLTKSLPKSVYPAATVYHDQTTIETTLFEEL